MSATRKLSTGLIAALLVLAVATGGSVACDNSEIDQREYCHEPCRCPPSRLHINCYPPGDALCWCDCGCWIIAQCPNVTWEGYLYCGADAGAPTDASQ